MSWVTPSVLHFLTGMCQHGSYASAIRPIVSEYCVSAGPGNTERLTWSVTAQASVQKLLWHQIQITTPSGRWISLKLRQAFASCSLKTYLVFECLLRVHVAGKIWQTSFSRQFSSVLVLVRSFEILFIPCRVIVSNMDTYLFTHVNSTESICRYLHSSILPTLQSSQETKGFPDGMRALFIMCAQWASRSSRWIFIWGLNGTRSSGSLERSLKHF